MFSLTTLSSVPLLSHTSDTRQVGTCRVSDVWLRRGGGSNSPLRCLWRGLSFRVCRSTSHVYPRRRLDLSTLQTSTSTRGFFILEKKQRRIFWFLSFSSRSDIKGWKRGKRGSSPKSYREPCCFWKFVYPKSTVLASATGNRHFHICKIYLQICVGWGEWSFRLKFSKVAQDLRHDDKTSSRLWSVVSSDMDIHGYYPILC